LENSVNIFEGPSLEQFKKLYESEDWREGVIRFKLTENETMIVQVRTYTDDGSCINFYGWICTEVQTSLVIFDRFGKRIPVCVVIVTEQEINGEYWPSKKKLNYNLIG